MNELVIKRVALSFGLISFAVLLLGSLWNGSRLFTAFVRGIEGAVIFGLLAWGVCSMMAEEEEIEPPPTDSESEEEEQEEAQLDKTA